MKRTLAASVLLSVAITLLLVNWLDADKASKKETAFERVSRTGVLRCGYGVWDPFVSKDPATGAMSGFWIEAMDEIGKLGGFKVEWTAEVDWGTIALDLQQGKIDAHCAGIWPNSNRGRGLLFTHPLAYMPTLLMVRSNDQRFQGQKTATLAEINQPRYSVGVQEGDVTEAIAQGDLPLVKRIALPPQANVGIGLAGLIAGKYDFFLGPKVVVQDINKKGIAIRAISLTPAPRTYGSTNAVAVGEQDLRDWLNAASDEFLITAGYQRLFDKYARLYPDALLQPSLPYKQ